MWVTIYKSPKIENKREFMDPLDKYKRVQKSLEYHFYWATHAFHEEKNQWFKIIFRETLTSLTLIGMSYESKKNAHL